MNPQENLAFGGGPFASDMAPAAMVLLLIAVILAWYLPRKYTLAPILTIAILVPMEQQMVVMGVHLMVLRIVLLCVWARILGRVVHGEELVHHGLQTVDKLMMASVLTNAIMISLQWRDLGAIVNRVGFVYSSLGLYFMIRHFVWDMEDARRLVKTVAVICAVVALLMFMEQLTGRNLLASLGAPAMAEIRNGRIRSQASFMHSIIAGTCGAILLPVFCGLWWTTRNARRYAGLGIAAAIVMIITSASSTPVGTAAAAMGAIAMWSIRRTMKTVRWAVVLVLLMLHLTMKAPVWALIARVDLAGGSTGYHRFMLVDNFIRRFSEWWLIGTHDNAKWGYDMWDMINYYVSAGISGGLLGFVLFIAILVYCYKGVGRFVHSAKTNAGDKRFAWCLGASMFSCCVAFFGIVFFDQSIVFWYSLIAMIVTLSAVMKDEQSATQAAPVLTRRLGEAPECLPQALARTVRLID